MTENGHKSCNTKIKLQNLQNSKQIICSQGAEFGTTKNKIILIIQMAVGWRITTRDLKQQATLPPLLFTKL